MLVDVGSDLNAVSLLMHGAVGAGLICPQLLTLGAQNEWGLGYKAEYNSSTSVGTVVLDFSRRFSLPFEYCQARHRQNELSHQQIIGNLKVGNSLVLPVHVQLSLLAKIQQPDETCR